MNTWKTHLLATLRRLARTHAAAPLPEVEHWLTSVFEAQSVRFSGPDGQTLPAGMTLQRLMESPFEVNVVVPCSPTAGERHPQADSRAAASPAPGSASRFHSGEAPANLADLSHDPRFERFVHEFDRLEHGREFMWAGYIVRDLLPRLGFPAQEAKLILDRMRTDGLLTMTKVPNPNHPSFPATGVLLNREHPRVQAILGAPAGSSAPPAPPVAPTEPKESETPEHSA